MIKLVPMTDLYRGVIIIVDKYMDVNVIKCYFCYRFYILLSSCTLPVRNLISLVYFIFLLFNSLVNYNNYRVILFYVL